MVITISKSTARPYSEAAYKNFMDHIRRSLDEWHKKCIKKDGLYFREMRCSVLRCKNHIVCESLQFYVSSSQTSDRAEGFYRSLIKNAEQMTDELPAGKYTAEEKDWLKKFIHSLAIVLSGDRYEAIGLPSKNDRNDYCDDCPLGRYQITPQEWIRWSRKYFDGRVVNPCRQAQEYIAFGRIMENYGELSRKHATNRNRLYVAMARRWGGKNATEKILEIMKIKNLET